MHKPTHPTSRLIRTISVVALATALLSGSLFVHARISRPPAASLNPPAETAISETAPVAPASATPAIITHTVATGDTLWDIAAKYNTDVESIMSLNSLTRSSSLKIGQSLRILTIKGAVHQVKSGDSIDRLAAVYGVKADVIVSANNLPDAAKLAIGQELIIPGGKTTTVATTSRGGTTRPTTPTTPTTSTKSYSWPVRGVLTSGFGSRWGKLHAGIDIGVPTGTAVKAARAGTVTLAGWYGNYGYAVIIDHGGGATTLYGHNSQLLAKVGDKVEVGDVIARSGSTGKSTGPHVHFEVRLNGKAVNPLGQLK